MEPILENPFTKHLNYLDYVHKIRDLIALDEEMISHIRNMLPEEKMEIIVALNDIVKSLLSLME